MWRINCEITYSSCPKSMILWMVYLDVMVDISIEFHIWRFPKSWGYPQSASIWIGLFHINHPAIRVPPLMETSICCPCPIPGGISVAEDIWKLPLAGAWNHGWLSPLRAASYRSFYTARCCLAKYLPKLCNLFKTYWKTYSTFNIDILDILGSSIIHKLYINRINIYL